MDHEGNLFDVEADVGEVFFQVLETFGLVGESGCGKSTLARQIIRLEEPTEGEILYNGEDLLKMGIDKVRNLRGKIQMVFQDPYESLNPTQTIEEIVTEPLIVHGMGASQQEREERVKKAMEDAGLKPAEVYLSRYPHELSGGQRQRVVIAAALVL